MILVSITEFFVEIYVCQYDLDLSCLCLWANFTFDAFIILLNIGSSNLIQTCSL